MLTLPALLAVTLIAQVVWCVGADGLICTGVGGARGEDIRTRGPAVWKLTHTGETCKTVHTHALIQTGTGPTLVDVHLAEVSFWRKREDRIFRLDHGGHCRNLEDRDFHSVLT